MNSKNMSWKMLIVVMTIISGCTGQPGPPGPQGPQGLQGPAGSARAYARWVLGTGLVSGQTQNFTGVTSPSDGIYCLTPAPGIDPAKTVAFGAYAADGVPANNIGRPAFVDIVYGIHDCPAGQYEVVTGTTNPDGTVNIHKLNGFAIVVP